MANQALKNFAEELKSFREQKQISLQQIANKTRIDIKFLKAIEDGNFEVQPEIYVRAFIQEYCQFLDLNPREMLSKFEMAKTGKDAGESAPEPGEDKNNQPESGTKPEFDSLPDFQSSQAPNQNANLVLNKKQVYYFGAAAAAVVLIVAYLIFFKGSSPEIITEKSYDEILNTQLDRFQVVADSLQRESAAQGDSLQLKIEATDTVWIKSIADDNTIKEFLLRPNRNVVIRAISQFNLIIGNAGGIRMTWNNTKIDSVGKRGEVKSILLSKDGMKYLPITLPPKDEQKNTKKN